MHKMNKQSKNAVIDHYNHIKSVGHKTPKAEIREAKRYYISLRGQCERAFKLKDNEKATSLNTEAMKFKMVMDILIHENQFGIL